MVFAIRPKHKEKNEKKKQDSYTQQYQKPMKEKKYTPYLCLIII